jgi:hypothetical protein
MVNNEFEMIFNEAVIAEFQILSWHLPTGTDEKQAVPQPGYLVSQPEFKLSTP